MIELLYILITHISSESEFQSLSLNCKPPDRMPRLQVLVEYEDDYVQPLILKALTSRLPPLSYVRISRLTDLPDPSCPVLQYTSYERLDFDHLLSNPTSSLANAYIIRKALIRKHYLSNTIANWITKHPESILKDHVKPAVDFELDYAEFLDEALLEAYELKESWARNETKDESDREWWILKPSMSDRGQGIRLFSSEDELRNIFEEWEAEQPESDSDTETESNPDFIANVNATRHDTNQVQPKDNADDNNNKDYIITSQLRHFIAQPYIHPPLVLPSSQNRKFHIRTYVLAVGSLRVYVYREMLALFAAEPYSAPRQAAQDIDLNAHLTNTCLQPQNQTQTQTEPGAQQRGNTVRRFWALEDDVDISLPRCNSTSKDWKTFTHTQILHLTSELFLAAASTNMIHFQTLPNAFEIFGLDSMLDDGGRVWLLEVNAFPDFARTGEELRDRVVGGLVEEVVRVAVGGFFGLEGTGEGHGGEENRGKGGGRDERMELVLDLDLGRR